MSLVKIKGDSSQNPLFMDICLCYDSSNRRREVENVKTKKRKILIWVLVLAVIAVLALGGMMRTGENALYADTEVTTGDISTTYSFTGSIVAPRSQSIVASAPGKIRDLYIEANQMVKEGDRLMKLSSGEVIRAEIDGEVISLHAEQDDPVSAGSLLAVISDVSRMEAEIQVDEYDVAAIELGREVSVTVNALDVTCEGSIKRFDKQAISMGTMASYTAGIDFDVPDKALPGMQVEVKMLNQKAENTLLLKVDALQFDEQNQTYVLTKNADGEYDKTYVETGINDGSTVQILSGLQDGQTVYYSAGIDIAALMQAMRGGR